MRKKAVIRVTANFERNLEDIRLFLAENDAGQVFDVLLDHLFETVIPNLGRFPEMGRDFFARKPRSVEGYVRWEKLRKRLGEASLREYLWSDYLLLYVMKEHQLYLLAIKHHRQLSFDLEGFWR
ncbi:MAG: type II toxin-antitoxin system RelE/ParE family toxin [Gammaproteobacteria bacterium]|nr:type II toxin-antitoxin system RelE/ParE family toxin [Gammaproteobacteria bacterium]